MEQISQAPVSHSVDRKMVGNQNTSFLKILAMVAMIVDHLGVALFPEQVELRVIGRIAFPLYAWCMVVGCVKTRSMPRYILRTFAMALICQPLYMLALGYSWQDLNILFLLTLALLAIWAIQARKGYSHIWGPLLCYLAFAFLNIDGDWLALSFVLMLYLLRNQRKGLIIGYLLFAMYWGTTSEELVMLFGVYLPIWKWPSIGQMIAPFFRVQSMMWLALPLILWPMESRWRMPRWLSYSIYPLHLVLIVLIRLCVGTPLTELIRVFG